ncbi:short chain dehydrogenase/reductase family oxidoreductase [Burkholderia pseudomallei]|nr:short chain dehydrogenase/reductase family oxidoreductase [Burkholderia pseudomallei]
MAVEKVALITAAGKGMGAAIARELASAGYRVALMSPSGSAVALAGELDGLGLRGSVTEEADLDRLVRETLARYGRIDAVVNNTGHPPKGELLSIADASWHDALDLILLKRSAFSGGRRPGFRAGMSKRDKSWTSRKSNKQEKNYRLTSKTMIRQRGLPRLNYHVERRKRPQTAAMQAEEHPRENVTADEKRPPASACIEIAQSRDLAARRRHAPAAATNRSIRIAG